VNTALLLGYPLAFLFWFGAVSELYVLSVHILFAGVGLTGANIVRMAITDRKYFNLGTAQKKLKKLNIVYGAIATGFTVLSAAAYLVLGFILTNILVPLDTNNLMSAAEVFTEIIPYFITSYLSVSIVLGAVYTAQRISVLKQNK